MSRRVFVLGGSGLLGRSLLRHTPPGIEVLAPSETDLPMEETERLARFLREEAVDVIALLAAWTAVDDCEADPARAHRINGILPGRVASLADRLGLPLLFLSTDYVFDGKSTRPYREFDPVGPLSVYGRSKWYGECAVRENTRRYRIVRSAGLYGPGGPDFVEAIRGRLGQGPVEVVTDEVNAPTSVEDLAPALWRIALGEESGTWHLTSAGEVSRFELARRIAELLGHDPDLVRPTTHAKLGRPAPRPVHSVLDCQAAREVFGLSLPSWEDGLRRHLASAGTGGKPSARVDGGGKAP